MSKPALYLLTALSFGPMVAGFTAALGVLLALEVAR